MASIDPFNRLVRLTARAFYDDITTKGENQNQPKAGRSDNRGIAVVILDALTRQQWIKEEDLARDLKLHTKQLRRTLRFFEEEKLVTRDHRKENAKSAKMYNAAVTMDGQRNGREGDEKQKVHTQSYCRLDYSQIYDVVRYRLHRMKKKLKDELESRNVIPEYICTDCTKRFSAFDVLQLISPYDEYFHCERCNGILMAESELAARAYGDGDDNASKHRNDKLKDMLTKLEVQLKPLIDQLGRVKDLPAPEFEGLPAWLLRKAADQAVNGDNPNDPSKSMHGLGSHMPYVGETKVEVAFSGTDDKGDVKSVSMTPMKVLPPWMIKQGMNLTKEQRGETSQEVKMGANSIPFEISEDKKLTTVDDDSKKIQEEYAKAYYAALLLQREKEEKIKKETEPSNSERQVGMKSKREDEFEDDNEWEEGTSTGNTTDHYKVHDLNMEAEATQDDEEDENDWEDG